MKTPFAILFATFASISAMAADSPPPLQTEFVFEAHVVIDTALIVGESSHGLRRIIPIKGGTVAGPGFKARVVPGGADWQFVRPDGALELLAKYTLETDDGVLILVENRGVRYAKKEVMDRMAKGEKVDASEYYFRTTTTFEAPLGSKYAWMNHTVFAGSAERMPNDVVIRFYKIK